MADTTDNTDVTDVTTAQAVDALAAARAAELDVLADTRPNPPWVWPAFGLTAAVFIASFDLVGGSPWAALSSIAYAVVIGLIVGRLQRHRGTQPKLSRLPAELRRQIMLFAIAGGVLMGVAMMVATLLLSGPPRFTVIGVLIGVAMVVGGRWADERYIEAAERIRAGHPA